MHRSLQNVRLAVRSIRRAPGFSAVTVATLALGMGLATAVFSVADAMLRRPLAVREQERLVMLAGATRDGRIDDYPMGVDAARDLAERSQALERLTFFAYEGAVPMSPRDDASGGGGGGRLRRALVAGDFFEVLGTTPLLGRALSPTDDVAGAAPVLVLSHRAWRSRFNGAQSVLGERVTLHEDGRTYTIVGVMPQGLDFPRGVDVWAGVLAATPPERHQYIALNALGRLAAGATLADARNEMTAYYERSDAPAWQRELRGTARPFEEVVLGNSRAAVLAFVAASALLLLITCLNVANLLLVRGLERVREFAVRSALGARRHAIVGQLFTEHAVLAIVGGVLGVGVAAMAIDLFVALAPTGLPRLDEVSVDARTLGIAAGITSLSLFLFGLFPALTTDGGDVQHVLRAGMRVGTGRRARRTSEGLVVGQVAIALLVLSAAALLGRTLVRLDRAELALQPAQLLVAELALRAEDYESVGEQAAMLDRLLPALAAIPGIEAASPVVAAPFAGRAGWDGRPTASGQSEEEAARNPMLNMEVVTPDYFATIGTPILRGRGFTEADGPGAPTAAILSQSAAEHYWPGEDPLGREMRMGDGEGVPRFTVVGIVPDTRYRDLREARASIYFPLRQSFFPFAPRNLVIRSTVSLDAVVPALRRTLAEQAPGVALASVAPFERLLDAPLAQPRLNAILLAIFAGAAVTLSAIGLFGVLATMVRQRTREFGVRLALGATTGQVRTLVLRRGLALAGMGTALGLAGALVTNRLLQSLLFQVSPSDGFTLAAIAALLLAVTMLASALSARASTRISPADALAAE